MKLSVLRSTTDGSASLYLSVDDRLVSVDALAAAYGAPELAGLADVGELLRRGDVVHTRLRDLAPRAQDLEAVAGPVSYAPPVVDPAAVVCVGLNYDAHIAEAGRTRPERIVLFAKYASSLTGHNEPVLKPAWTHELDYEGELAVVIGRTASKVSPTFAMDYVAGYTIMNDISARDLQRAEPQWIRAKASDSFAPVGPVFVDIDSAPAIDDLIVRTTVNGELRQNESCRSMITQVPELIAHISQSMTLRPGDIIATGTPAGVALGMAEPVYLRHGDVVSVSIEGIGELVNTVVDA
ncbi:fumarylacetoacetate hydrolase family protein [Rhodococcus sp. NPDC060176]|uniref:fumarylacetoacetate hydrolase family protein n=1 Tax=Rhodococcus sp. NPDC060176 TaxID=3347062 RepID=UPI00366A5282